MRNYGDFFDNDYDLEKMCRHAVDRSAGQLQDINIEYFATDDLLRYIADRSPYSRTIILDYIYLNYIQKFLHFVLLNYVNWKN